MLVFRSMKILFLTSYYGEAEGGADISTKLLAEGLKKNDASVEIASINATPRARVHSLLSYWPLPTSVIAFLLNTSFLDCHLERRLQTILQSVKPDIVHVHDLMLLPAAVQAAKKNHVSCVVTVRDLRFLTNLPILSMNDLSLDFSSKITYFSYLAQQKGWVMALAVFPFIFSRARTLRKALRQATKVVAISRFVKKQLQVVGISDVQVIYNPMPEWTASSVRHKGTIFFAPGRLEWYKGFHLLIEAMKEFAGKDVTLYIAGTGPEEKRLKEATASYGLESQVIFLGKLPSEETRKYYVLCDAVLFPSLWPEPLGRVPLEAMAMEKPCIATDVGGVRETIGKGLLVEPAAMSFVTAMDSIVQKRLI